MMKLPDTFPTKEELLTIIMHTTTSAWDNCIVEKDIDLWLQNFTGEVYSVEVERLLALWMLGHFTYYNKDEVKHLTKVVFADLIHHIVQDNVNGEEPEQLVNNFFSTANIISPGRTSDSGGFIAYIFRHENKLPVKLFNFSIDNINEEIENLLVIDDVSLTAKKAGQAHKFFKEARKKFPKKKFVLLTLVANKEVIALLMKDFDVCVISAIILDDRDKSFHIHSDVFSSFTELIPVAEKFARHYGRKTHPGMEAGYENGQYSFGFYYNTPNNCLPIFWGENNGWVPVLKRYTKSNKYSSYLKDERFI